MGKPSQRYLEDRRKSLQQLLRALMARQNRLKVLIRLESERLNSLPEADQDDSYLDQLQIDLAQVEDEIGDVVYHLQKLPAPEGARS